MTFVYDKGVAMPAKPLEVRVIKRQVVVATLVSVHNPGRAKLVEGLVQRLDTKLGFQRV